MPKNEPDLHVQHHGGVSSNAGDNNNNNEADTSQKVSAKSPSPSSAPAADNNNCSQLKLALTEKPTANLASPLLTASLNSPPITISAVDLSSSLRKRSQHHQSSPRAGSASISPETSQDGSNSGVLYANLLMQLRNQVAAIDDSQVSGGQMVKLTAAARKERLKSQLCFQCPVCKKRFQRHIAMNAHFTTEHVGRTSSNEKICKMCSFVGSSGPSDMTSIRYHLMSKHNIDLDTPTACLVEPEIATSRSSSPLSNAGDKQKSGAKNSTKIMPSSSCIMVQEMTSTGCSVKQEILDNPDDNDNETAKDLSMKKVGEKRPNSPELTKSKKLRKINPTTSEDKWTCQHCSIIFPDQTLYFLHRGFHSNGSNPWKCNGCGLKCTDMYEFNTHLMSDAHQ